MTAIPPDLGYTSEHEWVALDGDIATIGITAYAAEQLGDVVYVDLPKPGTAVEAGRVVGEIESTKSVGELYAPVSGEVLEANQAVVDDPSLVNADAYAAWLVKVRVDGQAELLDAEAYGKLIAK